MLVLFAFFSTASAADAPTLTELERLQLTVLVRDYELAQAKTQIAQTAEAAARDKVILRLREIDAAHPGYRFDLQQGFVPEQK